MLVSQNKGTPILTPKYYDASYGDPQNGTPNFEKHPNLRRRYSNSMPCNNQAPGESRDEGLQIKS